MMLYQYMSDKIVNLNIGKGNPLRIKCILSGSLMKDWPNTCPALRLILI